MIGIGDGLSAVQVVGKGPKIAVAQVLMQGQS